MSGRSVWLAIIALILLIPITVMTIVIILGLTGYWNNFGYWAPMYGMMSIGWVFMLIPLTFLVILLIIVLVAASRSRGYQTCGGPWDWRGGSHPYDPETILESRYARGEITREELLRMREDLRKK